MKLASLALVLTLGSAALPAHASRALRVSMGGCHAWSPVEVERLTRLELTTLGGGESDEGNADVQITCDDTGATLKASDAAARRSLSRRIRLAMDAEDGERVLAISAAQLVRALDWLPPMSAAAIPVEPPVVLSTPTSPPALPPPRRPALELQLGAGPRARDARLPFMTYSAAVGSAVTVGSVIALGGALHYERGDAERALGEVRAELVGAAVRAALERWRGKHWSCLLRAELGVSRLSLRGQDSVIATRTGRASGFGAEAQLAIGPLLRSGRMGVGLLAQGGGSYFGGQGLVSDEQAVSLDGAWAGLELAVLWAP